ncbi:MAG: hypothetical protein IPH78_07035 [Bacteroidetes bacterium]|nr:hypothetical protein [Bacteroidota bacterium]MBK8658108.1 hypothetical protein [Bacteroidota bacterium]
MKRIFFAALALIALTESCKNTEKAKSSTIAPVVNDTVTDLSNRKIIKDAELYAAVTDAILIDTIYLSKDSLHLLTSKIRACESENFKLLWNGKTTKSLPPQVSLKLFLANDAACKEQHRFHLSYHVRSLKMKGDSAQSLILKVSGAKQFLKYE